MKQDFRYFITFSYTFIEKIQIVTHYNARMYVCAYIRVLN